MTTGQTAEVSSGTPRSNNRLIVWQSIMAGLSYMSAAGALADILPAKIVAALFVVIGGLQAATAAYMTALKPVQTPVQVVTVDLHRP